ncbi:MAG: hypothetical protein Kow00121_36220 [Elainellaceae cyanobacterium]
MQQPEEEEQAKEQMAKEQMEKEQMEKEQSRGLPSEERVRCSEGDRLSL